MTVLAYKEAQTGENGSLTLEAKAALLRTVETYCYQVTYHVLQEEGAARKAAEEALLELYRTAAFFVQEAQERTRMARSAALRQALQIRSRTLRG